VQKASVDYRLKNMKLRKDGQLFLDAKRRSGTENNAAQIESLRFHFVQWDHLELGKPVLAHHTVQLLMDLLLDLKYNNII
jgi:hypothetical protein